MSCPSPILIHLFESLEFVVLQFPGEMDHCPPTNSINGEYFPDVILPNQETFEQNNENMSSLLLNPLVDESFYFKTNNNNEEHPSQQQLKAFMSSPALPNPQIGRAHV